MALTVLIVEDEQSASRLLSGIAAEVGLSARATGSGKEAQQLCAQAADSGQPFSVVVLDLVLSELDGFQFGTAARAAAWGAKLPIIVVSGVYKKLPEEFAARIRPAAFFAKPFEPAALRAALAKHSGAQRDAPPRPPGGFFSKAVRAGRPACGAGEALGGAERLPPAGRPALGEARGGGPGPAAARGGAGGSHRDPRPPHARP